MMAKSTHKLSRTTGTVGTSSAQSLSRGARDMMWVEQVTKLMDTRFRIPGTNIKFGADFLMGLVPGAGDMVSLGFSGMLIATMARNGASPRLVARMLLNVLLDAIAGSIPLAGNIFDLFFRANTRNYQLMREHYVEGKHTGSVWPIVLAVVAVLAAVFAVFAVLFFFVARWLLEQINGLVSG